MTKQVMVKAIAASILTGVAAVLLGVCVISPVESGRLIPICIVFSTCSLLFAGGHKTSVRSANESSRNKIVPLLTGLLLVVGGIVLFLSLL